MCHTHVEVLSSVAVPRVTSLAAHSTWWLDYHAAAEQHPTSVPVCQLTCCRFASCHRTTLCSMSLRTGTLNMLPGKVV